MTTCRIPSSARPNVNKSIKNIRIAETPYNSKDIKLLFLKRFQKLDHGDIAIKLNLLHRTSSANILSTIFSMLCLQET